MTSGRSPRRKSPAKQNRSPRRKSPVKKSRSLRRKSPVKKSRSLRRKSPVKKSRSPRRKSPVKKSRSPRQKSHKRMLKGGRPTGTERRHRKKEKPESDASEASTELDTSKVTEVSTELDTSKVTEASTESDTSKVTEASTESDTSKITEASTESDGWTLTGRVMGEASKERKQIRPLQENLYRRNDLTYNNQIKILRDFYIALWNKYNPSIYHPFIPKSPLTPDQEKLRKYYNDITNNKSSHNIKNILNKGKLLYSTEFEENNQTILNDPRIFIYSIDSINRHPHRAKFPKNPKINFKVSPHSFEIHCNTNNRYTTGESMPARFVGHVTLILTRRLSPDQIGKIMSYTEDNDKSDAQKHFSEIYHYGATIFKGEIVESWWQTFDKLPEEKTRYKSVTLDERDMMNIPFGTETYFPDCSVGKFMKEYYLYCINTCPTHVVFRGVAKSGYSTLTIRDFTNWGSPKTLL